MKKPPRDCPCHSKRRYKECCAPLHKRSNAADDVVQLMRSRYAAYALGDAVYLWDTLDPLHPERRTAGDSDAARDAWLAEIRLGASRMKFMGLEILDSAADERTGAVLFVAHLFEKGADHSFVERSTFRRDNDGGFRYLDGLTVDLRKLNAPVESLKLATFEALHRP